jgi:hypothetical protein
VQNDTNPILAELDRLARTGRFPVKVGRPRQLGQNLYQIALNFPDSTVEQFQVCGRVAQVGEWWGDVFALQAARNEFASDMARIMRNDE